MSAYGGGEGMLSVTEIFFFLSEIIVYCNFSCNGIFFPGLYCELSCIFLFFVKTSL